MAPNKYTIWKYISWLILVYLFDIINIGVFYILVRLADKPWQKVLLADLLWEKNTAEWLADSAAKQLIIRLISIYITSTKITYNEH
jgi:hypothetical protein